MNRLRITCPLCSQVMEVRETDADKKLRCARCKETFRHEADVPQSTVKFAAGTQVISVDCHQCGEQFGVKPAMSGKKLACPKCKCKQRFFLLHEEQPPEERATKNKLAVSKEALQKTAPTEPTRAVVKNEADAGNRATVVHSTATRDQTDEILSERVKQLLPPRYTVDDEVDRQAVSEVVEETAPAISLGIDTEITRIHRSTGEAVEVQSLTLNEKRRRKSFRVAIVYVVSVLILVALCVWLVKSLGSGE